MYNLVLDRPICVRPWIDELILIAELFFEVDDVLYVPSHEIFCDVTEQLPQV
jgi:hypothetical protein